MTFPKNLEESIESKFSKLASKKNKQGKEILSLGLGEPDFNTPEIILRESYNAMKLGKTKYSSPMGITSLRKKLSEHLKINNKIKANIDNIIITSGAKMSLTLALSSILKKNMSILNINPCYPSYIPQILISEHQAKIINFDLKKNDFSIDFEKLKSLIEKYKVKVMLINFPNNPTGITLDKNSRKKIVELIYKYKIILISDEVYDKLVFNGEKHISLGSYRKIANQVITINSFSKSFAMTGWRIGYMVANEKIIEKACKIQQHINTNVPEFIQHGALKALSIPPIHLKKYNVRLLNNYRYLKFQTSQIGNFPISESNGGLFVFLNISKDGRTSDAFCRDLIDETNVACTPGIFFGKNWDSFIRISLAINEISFKKAINLLINFIIKRRKNI